MSLVPLPVRGRKRVAVIGAGISGLGAAWALRDVHNVTLLETRNRLGGHAHTVDIDYDGTRIAVDTGFIVFNPLNYPNMLALFSHLGVESFETDMSFGFSSPDGPEWSSNGLGGVFAQWRNLASPRHHRMLCDILRFNDRAPKALAAGEMAGRSMADWLSSERFGAEFRDRYLFPMGAAIWSSSEDGIGDFPAESFVRFFENHRLMNIDRPIWRTVTGGSRSYVNAIYADIDAKMEIGPGATSVQRNEDGVIVRLETGEEREFDDVILACHSDQALRLLVDPSQEEKALIGAIRYAPNRVVLHRDTSFLPQARGARAAWNYRVETHGDPACVTYDMNKLQGIDRRKPLFVTLNPQRDPDPSLTFGEWEYDHPQFNTAAIAAQRVFNSIQGVNRTWFAGAWLGYGFHEDGLRAGLRVALRLGGRIPWRFVEGDISGGDWGEPAPRPSRKFSVA